MKQKKNTNNLYYYSLNDDKNIEIDVHSFSSNMAISVIQKTIVNNPSCKLIIVIHGYNRGTIIKTILKDKNNIHNKRVVCTKPVPFNEGRTFIYLR